MTALHIGKPICRSPLWRVLLVFSPLRRYLLYTSEGAICPIFLLVSTAAVLWSGVVQAAPGTFVSTGSLAIPRAGHTATLLQNGQVLVAGGYAPQAPLNSAELYDPLTGMWRSTRSFNTIQDSGS